MKSDNLSFDAINQLVHVLLFGTLNQCRRCSIAPSFLRCTIQHAVGTGGFRHAHRLGEVR